MSNSQGRIRTEGRERKEGSNPILYSGPKLKSLEFVGLREMQYPADLYYGSRSHPVVHDLVSCFIIVEMEVTNFHLFLYQII